MTYCRYAPSLGALEGTPEEAWGTPEYKWWKHRKEPCVFFGLYDLRDYLFLWLHKGKKYVLWAGSDITNLKHGFVFNDGKLKWLSLALRGVFRRFILRVVCSAENWAENRLEASELDKLGVKVKGYGPSYMGPTELPLCFKPGRNVYLSASGGRTIEYGFGIVERIANWLPHLTFHLYGSDWETRHENVIVHGRVPKEQMNKEIKEFQIGLRLNDFDGFSEICAKAVLQGQYAIGKVKHPRIPSFENDYDLIIKLNALSKKQVPNEDAQAWYRDNLNNYPWVCEV